MTVLSELSKIAYIGSSSQTLYPIPFEYINTDDVKVSIYTSNNEFVEDWTYSIQYVIEDGNVKVLSGYNIDNTKKLLILRSVDLIQDNKYREGGDFPAKSTETSFDKLTMITQQLQETLDRCVKVEVLDNQSPEELLQTVYDKLDSATEIAGDAISAANQAQTAADNATAAVNSAEQTLVQTQAYVDSAKVEINNTKNTAINTINSTVTQAKADVNSAIDEATTNISDTSTSAINTINSVKDSATSEINSAVSSAETEITNTKNAAINTINTAVSNAESNISTIVSDAEGSITNIAVTEANKAIANAAQEATDTAKANVNSYVDGTVKPSLQTYVTQAQEDANSAATSMEQAALSATAASNYASNASADADNAAESAGLAANSAAAAKVSETNAKASETNAKASETNAAATKAEVEALAELASFGNIGDIKYTSRTDVPNGGAWCDGAEYTQTMFPDIYQMLVDGKIQSTTYQNFTSSVSTNGSCGFFALDTGAQKFKVPLLKDVYIKAGQAPLMFGAESLPNIKGIFYGRQNGLAGGSGAFYEGNNPYGGMGSGSYNNQMYFDASRSSSTYKDGAKVNPDHVVYRAYVVLYSSAAEASVAQVAEFMTALDGKQDISNLSQTLDDSTTKYPSNKAVKTAIDAKDSLPSQAGNNGKFLTTNGTNPSWADVGGGLEIGDIGFAPLGIDETQNKRRYLNGQVISQVQFVSFTNKIKSAIGLYPNLATTEENWQAEKTNSKLGQCGKFVIDDTLGTIRLPCVVNAQGLFDLQNLGMTVSAGLPNITGTVPDPLGGGNGTWTGAFTKGSLDNSATTSAIDYDGYKITFDASLSNPIYGKSNTVQQEAIQYPYFIQIATGVEESVDVSTEIQLNNPFSLLDYKWSEYEITNASWLLSNGAFHSGTVYTAVYELLLKIKNGTVTKEGVSVKLSTEAYTDTDFVLNTSDTTFRLPIKVKLASGKAVVGNGMVLGLTDGTKNYGLSNSQPASGSNLTSFPGDYGKTLPSFRTAGSAPNPKSNMGITTDPTKSGIETSSSGLKLYFYVGETIQDANVIAASQVLTRVADSVRKSSATDRETVVGWGMPDYSAGVSEVFTSLTTAPSNGFFEVNGQCYNNELKIELNGIAKIIQKSANKNYSAYGYVIIPVFKGDTIKGISSYDNTGSIVFYPCRGV